MLENMLSQPPEKQTKYQNYNIPKEGKMAALLLVAAKVALEIFF